jgi:hypothetical protein
VFRACEIDTLPARIPSLLELRKSNILAAVAQ